MIVKIFAVLDRRIGKRRLLKMKDTICNEPDTFQVFYAIRANAEGLRIPSRNEFIQNKYLANSNL